MRTFLRHLENDGMINQQTNNKTTKLSICNYESYQNKQPADQQQTNQRLTSAQPALNQRLTTNNNEKQQEPCRTTTNDPANGSTLDFTNQEPPKKTVEQTPDFNWWRSQHPKIKIARRGDDGDAEAWRYLWQSCHRDQQQAMIREPDKDWFTGPELFTEVYRRCVETLTDPSHCIFFDKFLTVYTEIQE